MHTGSGYIVEIAKIPSQNKREKKEMGTFVEGKIFQRQLHTHIFKKCFSSANLDGIKGNQL